MISLKQIRVNRGCCWTLRRASNDQAQVRSAGGTKRGTKIDVDLEQNTMTYDERTLSLDASCDGFDDIVEHVDVVDVIDEPIVQEAEIHFLLSAQNFRARTIPRTQK